MSNTINVTQLLRVLCIIFLLRKSLCACPNQCNGHGTCGVGNVCTCFSGWDGGAADCSYRTCPKGTAWADKAYAYDSAHQQVECSNAGICDKKTGACNCFEGFSGNACQRSACPNECNDRGVCMTIRDMSVFEGPDYDSTSLYAGDGLGVTYNNWDNSSVTLCDCDDGFFGSDCSLVMCPKGDDPITSDQNYREILLTVYGTMTGSLGFEFDGETTLLSLSSPSSTSCTKALETARKFGSVGCVYSEISSTAYTFTIAFYSWPTYPKENNIHTHDGNPPITDFLCDITLTNSDVYCVFSDITNTNIREYVYCANRGSCDFTTGICHCAIGYGGAACTNITYAVSQGSNVLPGMQVNVYGTTYQGSALHIHSEKSMASDFKMIQAIASSEELLYLRGDGLLNTKMLLVSDGGQTITYGGLTIIKGGLTISDDGVGVYYTQDSGNVMGVYSTSSTYASGSIAFLISTASTLPSKLSTSHYLLSCVNGGTSRFNIRGDGLVQVKTGGMKITGGLTIYSAGLTISSGITIQSSGLVIQAGGESINAGGLVVTGGVSIASNGLVVTGGVTIRNTGLTVSSGGLKVTAGGATINAGGFVVQAGGGLIKAGGFGVTNGITVYSNGIKVNKAGVSIQSGGLTVTGGITLGSLGLTIQSGGITITGGGTVISGGLVITGGISVQSSGLTVTSGVTINTGGLVITGGLTILNTGMTVNVGGIQVTGGQTVYSGGLVVSGGSTIQSGGLVLTGGVTINDAGLSIIAGGMLVTGTSTIVGDLYVTGNVYNLGTVLISDERLKTDIAPLEDSLAKITRLKGVYYSWIQDEVSGLQLDEERHVGVIAQDVQKVLPEVVSSLYDGRYIGVKYHELIPLLINAIKELNDRKYVLPIEDSTLTPPPTDVNNASYKELENRLATLEALLNTQKDLVTQLISTTESLKSENKELQRKYAVLMNSFEILKSDNINLTKFNSELKLY